MNTNQTKPRLYDSAYPGSMFERNDGQCAPTEYGMSLRDYFAAKAMLGEITHQGLEGRDPDHIAGMAYEMADAMIRAREVRS